MKIGLQYTLHPNATKLNNIANLLLSGFGAGGAFATAFDNPKVGSIMIGLGLLIKGLATFTTNDELPNIPLEKRI